MSKVPRLSKVTSAGPAEQAPSPTFDASELLKSLPHRPGVYRMFNKAGETLYVGKARDLKKRVANYFQKSDHEPRIAAMVAQVARVETTVTRSEGEALLLENNLIKAEEPRYNILYRDDKSYPYVCLSGDAYPQLRFHRGGLDRKHRYFGPFPSAGAVREGIAMLQKVFQLRTCDDTVFANRSRPCMLHQIQRCSAPCVRLDQRDRLSRGRAVGGHVPAGEDRRGTNPAFRADGRRRRAASSSRRPRAFGTRSRGSISSSRVSSWRAPRQGDVDVVAAVAEGGLVALNVVMVRGGRHVGDRTFFPRHAEGSSLADVVCAFLEQHYVERPVPPTIIVPEALDTETLAEVLSAQSGRAVAIVDNPGGERRVWLTMAVENATFAVGQRLAQKASQEDRLALLQTALGLPPSVQRIECFDVSHTMGERAVASCVVFDRLAMQSGEYRRFNVTPGRGGR